MDKEWEKLEKISAWNLTKVRSKKKVIDEARTSGATVHFASLMDICHLKNAELEAKHQKYKGRVVLRGDIVKDNSGSYAVFTEQGSSFNISHFSSTACIAAMAKRVQQESGEGRVTAKSRPMMNLTARTPSFVSSSASSNPWRTSHGYQDPGKSVPSDDRTGKPVQPSRPDFMLEDYGRSWSSQEWKSGAAEHDRSGKPKGISWETLHKVESNREEPLLGRNAHSARYGETIHDRTGKPVSENLQEQDHFENFVMGSDATEFVNQVRDQVRNRHKECRALQSHVPNIQ